MSDKAAKVLGYIAVVPGSINVLCDGDSCVIAGSEKAMNKCISAFGVDSAVPHRITKARYGHVMTAMKMGGAYSLDTESFARFAPLAREDGLDILEFKPQGKSKPDDTPGIPLMRIQWLPGD